MGGKKRLFSILILSISILFGLLTIQNEAANETNETNNTSNTSNTSNTVANNTTTQTSTNTEASKNETKKSVNSASKQTTAKSSNANLNDLGITPHDFKGFKYGTTYYEVVVPEDTEAVEVYAKTQHEKATVTGTGKKKLEKGENKAEVVVTAEDGTKKTYTINIIREVQQEEIKDTKETEGENINDKVSNGLAELKINNLTLTPAFKTDVYEYKVKYIGEETKLNIETKPTSENYTVEVTGNEDLKEGENIITILVSEKNGNNVATYQITINKSLVDEEAVAREEAEKKEKQQKTIIGVTIAVVILIAIILFVVIRHKRNKNLAEEFSGAYYYGRNDDEEEYEEEFSRGLRKEKTEKKENGKDYDGYEEDELARMPKEKLKEQFLNNYTSDVNTDFAKEYQETRRKKHKGKRFK